MSDLISPFIVDSDENTISKNNKKEELSYTDMLFGPDYFKNSSSSSMPIEESKPKRGRPKKDTPNNSTTIVVPGAGYDQSLNADGSVNYHMPYNETDAIIKTTIGQTDVLLNDIAAEFSKIREAKAMTSKYRVMTDLTQSMSSLLSTKIMAARELNSSINHSQDMQFKMQKELKAMEVTKDDNKSIMDMYNAFMSIPVNSSRPLGPSIQDMTLSTGTGLTALDIVSQNNNANGSMMANDDAGYQNYLANLTPEQNRMRFENDPNIQTVVVFDQSNGRKWFDVIDVRTGQSVPNISKPDDFLLEDTRPDLAHGVARNSNINVTYPLRVVGDRSSIQEY